MGSRIEVVETVCQHSYGIEAVGQSLPMGTDIDAVGESADDEHLWTECSQVGNEPPNHVFSIGCAAPCADNVDDTSGVQVGIAFMV